MQDNIPHEQTEVSPPPETEPRPTHLPGNPVQSVISTWTSTDSEYVSPWSPAEDIDELEDTLNQAVAHLKKLLRRIGNRTNVDVIKARAFLEQFD